MSRARLLLAACFAAVPLLVLVPAAAAAEASADRVRALAARAQEDPAALRALRRIDRVDGRPVNLARALAGARDDELGARLRALAAAPEAATPQATATATATADARRRAAAIVAGDRFTGTPPPRPLRSLLARVGEVFQPLGRLFRRAEVATPGGGAVLWGLLGIAVLAAAWLVAGRFVRRRAVARQRDGDPRSSDRRERAARLERAAAAAERQGELEEAIRLRFRAGLLRLDERGTITFRPSISTTEVARRVGSAEFDRLAGTFNAVRYGHRPARPDDARAAREGWATVLREAGAR